MRVKLLILISFFFLTNLVFGQGKVPFEVRTLNKTTNKKEAGMVVKVFEGSTMIQSFTSDASGSIMLQLEPKKKYKIEVSKEGKVTRYFNVDLKNVDPELTQGTKLPSGSVNMSLFDQVPGIDYSYVTGNPATEFYYDPGVSSDEIVFDQVLANKMIAKVDKILKDAEASQKQGEANYNGIIKQADALFAAKKYEEALVQYEAATKIKGKETEKHPNNRIIEIDGILKAAKSANLANSQLDSEYKALITAADGLRDQKKYPEAIARYNEALAKKQEQYPKDEIVKCEAAIEAAKNEAANAEKYNAAIKAADGFYAQKSWMAARDKYKEALKLKPNDPVATGKLADLEGKLNAQKSEQEKKQKYNDAVAAGDALMTEEKWTEAKAKYTEALTFEAAATYPKEKIKEADVKLAEIAKANALKEQITKLLAEGNTAVGAKQYPAAKAKFEQVLTLDAENAEAKTKIQEINQLLEQEKANADKIAKAKQLIAEGDALDKASKYADAKAKYQESIALIPDANVQAKIDAMDARILAEGKKAEQKAKFDQAILDGDAAMTASNYEVAKKKYEEAQALDPASTVAKTKLIEVEKKIAQANAEKDKNQKYQEAFNAGVSALTSKDYTVAKEKFTAALAIDNTKTEAKDKLAEVDKILAENAKATALKDQVTKLLAEGNTAVGAKQYPAAKAKFEQVLTLDAENAEAKTKIQEINQVLEQEKASADKIAKAKQLIAEGDALDKATKYADAKAKYQESIALIPDAAVQAKIEAIDAKILADGKKAEQKAKFDQAILDGDAAMAASNFEAAKKKYEEAQLLDPASTVPKTKLIEVEKKMTQANAEKDKNQKYQEAFNAGVSALASKDYTTAKEKFTAAVAIDNTKTEAKEKLAEVDKILAENAQETAQKEKYEAAIKAGNDLLGQNKLAEAKKKYEEASLLDPAQALPKEKVKEIDALIAKADKEKQVTQLLAEGAAALSKKDLSGAKGKYQQVLTLEPSNATASEKILEISKLENDQASETQKLAAFEKLKGEGMVFQNQNKYAEAKQKYLEAKSIKADEEVEKAIAWCDKKIEEELKDAELNKKYNAVLTEAKNLETAKKYDEAIAKYNEALTIKNEQEPKNRISAIKALKEADAEQLKVEQEYQAALKKGDDLVAEKKYTEAVQAYNAALVLKPYEKLPVEKAENAKKLSEQESSDGDQAYQKIIDVGNKAFDEKNYVKAKEMFNRAANFRPADQYPKQKLAKIEEIEKEEKLALDQQNQFTKKMAEADVLAKANKLEEAIAAYKAAKTIKPDDVTPDQKIAELQTLLANKVDPAKEAKLLYDEAMLKGKNAAAGKDYNGAISHFEEALRHQPKDQAATNKIDEMRQLLDDIAKENAANKELASLITSADKEFNAGKWSSAKSAYDHILTKYPSNNYAYEQAKKCEIRLKEEADADKERVYRNLVNSANEKFNAANYKKAKELYERAVTQRPTDPYPRQKLNEINNILNPPVAQKTTKTEPESTKLELESLGEATDNSLTEGAKRLEQASRKRKGNTSDKITEKMKKVEENTSELSDKQRNLTLSSDSTLTTIKISNNERDAASNAKVQNNVDVIGNKQATVTKSNEENITIKELNIVNQKEQLEAANEAIIVTNSKLDGGAVDNNEIIKKSKSDLGETNTKLTEDKYSQITKNDVVYSNIRIEQEKNTIDDMEERLAEEKKVKDAEKKQFELNVESSDKAAAKTVETKEVLKNVENNIAVKATDEKQLSSDNNEVIKEIKNTELDSKVENTQAQVENSQRFASKNSQTEKIVGETALAKMEANRDNTVVIENVRDQKTEIERADYNKAYIKNIENKQAISIKAKDMEDKESLPSISSAENKKNFDQIQAGSIQSEKEKAALNDEKIASNEQKVRSTQKQIQEEGAQNTQAMDNANLITNSKKELGTTEQIQQDKTEEKTLASKKIIDDAAKPQPEKVPTGSYEVDLSKYPEGVSQEQFDQLGSDGLVSAVVTRRVVVRNGRADVYIRTQTMNGITYSKNGQGCTEIVWQRETQDAKLKRNY